MKGVFCLKTRSVFISVALGVVCLTASCTEACTTTIVTRGASADGSTYVTHSNDSYSSDPSIVFVPAKDHPAGSMRKVYPSAIAWGDLPEYACFSNPASLRRSARLPTTIRGRRGRSRWEKYRRLPILMPISTVTMV